jgi:competence protein ComEC
LRNQFIVDLGELHGSRRVIAIMQALLVGVGHEVLASDWRNFKMLGLAHVMVISGLHIGLVFLMVRVLCLAVLGVTPLHRMSVHRLSSILAILAATTYAAVAGMSVPATRALCMVLMTQIPRFMGWRSRPRWVLMASLLVLLAANPLSALSSSLWLTIGATYAVLRLSEALAPYGWWLRVLALQLLMTLLLAPLTAFWFGSVSFWGVIGNATVTPVVTMLAIPLLLAGALQDVVMGESANYFWWLCESVLRVALALLEWMADALPHQGFVSLSLSPYQFASLALVALLVFWTRQNLWFFGALISAVAVLGVSSLRPTSEARLQLLDVGQGTAIVFTEGSATLLYDTGAPYGPIDTQASRVIIPRLHQQGVDNLTHLVVSHRDSDHSGGLTPVLSEFRVAKHWGFGGQPCRVGQRLQWPGDAVIDMLNGSGWDQTHPNASSCVLRIRYGGQTVLLAGDIPASTERELVRYWREGLKSDIVAVAHHGSKTSTAWSWLKWIEPRLALISAGFDNRFGHPHPEVMDRLLSVGAQILDTRIAGGVQITFERQGGWRVTRSRHGMTPFWAQLSQLTQLGVSPGTGILKSYKEDTP